MTTGATLMKSPHPETRGRGPRGQLGGRAYFREDRRHIHSSTLRSRRISARHPARRHTGLHLHLVEPLDTMDDHQPGAPASTTTS
jgi:hypothetical protein